MNQPGSATSKLQKERYDEKSRPSAQVSKGAGSGSGGEETNEAQQMALSRAAETQLIERAKSGDREAFRELFGKYYRRAYSVALGMVKSPDDASDVVQDAFLKAHKYLPNFQGNSRFYTWLYRIVMNVAIDHIRKAGRVKVEDYEAVAERRELEAPEGTRNQGVSPQSSAMRSELQAQIQLALETLPEHHRAVIILREVEELSYEEIAESLDVPKGTVMSRLFHARRKMQEQLRPYLLKGLKQEEGAP